MDKDQQRINEIKAKADQFVNEHIACPDQLDYLDAQLLAIEIFIDGMEWVA